MRGRLRILVCGGRDYNDRRRVFNNLARWADERPIHIIQGGADGADRLAVEFARARSLPYTTYPADWKRHGRRAGPLRNQQMLDEGKPDIVLAFPGGRGTASMVRLAEDAGVDVCRFAENDHD